VIAIEALASGAADIGAVMGAVGYIEARNKNPKVDVLFVNSGVSGTLDDAIYYSWLCVNRNDADKYGDGGAFSIANIQGKRMSFVSNSSTSGFRVPTNGIVSFFKDKSLTEDDLVEGGSKAFFSEVLFGGSHQGSAFNLISGKADVAAFCDTELAPYAALKEGAESRVGAVYAIKPGASAPFDTVVGKEFVIIASTPVLNGPNAYNPQNLSAAEVQKIREVFTSEETANNKNFFYDANSGKVGFYKKTNDERYLAADDSWYDPIREMGSGFRLCFFRCPATKIKTRVR
jgi:phosphonate transport system substrate-binding protein